MQCQSFTKEFKAGDNLEFKQGNFNFADWEIAFRLKVPLYDFPDHQCMAAIHSNIVET